MIIMLPPSPISVQFVVGSFFASLSKALAP